MKRVNEYRKLFEAVADTDLKSLKSTYRNLVKEWHPDKFQDGDDKKEQAEEMSRQITSGYHFLVSIAPETKVTHLETYNTIIDESTIEDFKHKGLLLEITFLNGATYEYFGVNKSMYSKLVNADKQFRFAKRNIFHSYLYRQSKKPI